MSLEAIPQEVLERIREKLGLESFSRPFAVLIDPGDFGSVFTYLPLFREEFKKLPPDLQKYVYAIEKGRYGLVSFIPKSFEPFRGGNVTSIQTVINDSGAVAEMKYATDEGGDQLFEVKNHHRRDKLMELAKKKKIPQKSVIRSRC